MGPVAGDTAQEACEVAPCFLCQKAGLNLNTCLSQTRMTPAPNARIGILNRGHDAGDASFYQGIGAGSRAAMMAAGFERDIGGSTTGGFAGGPKSARFGMGDAAFTCPAGSENAAVFDQNAADCRILPSRPHGAAAKGKGMAHMVDIVHAKSNGTRMVDVVKTEGILLFAAALAIVIA
jgi:hypothetical protein